jgi:hypothetical protein
MFNEQHFFASVGGFYDYVMTYVHVLACHSSFQIRAGGEIYL